MLDEAFGQGVSVLNETDAVLAPAGNPGDVLDEAFGEGVSVLNQRSRARRSAGQRASPRWPTR